MTTCIELNAQVSGDCANDGASLRRTTKYWQQGVSYVSWAGRPSWLTRPFRRWNKESNRKRGHFAQKGLSRAKRYNVTSLPLPTAPRSEISPRGVLFAWKIKPARPPGTSPLSPLPFHRVRFDHPSLPGYCVCDEGGEVRRRVSPGRPEKRPKREYSPPELASQLFSTRIQEFKTSLVDRCEPFYLLEIREQWARGSTRWVEDRIRGNVTCVLYGRIENKFRFDIVGTITIAKVWNKFKNVYWEILRCSS